MDYSKFRRSTNVDSGDPNLTDLIALENYKKMLADRGVTPEQIDALLSQPGMFVPEQEAPLNSQVRAPMARELGIRDIAPLVSALRK